MTDDAVKRVLWWLCLFVAPAVLLAIELYHPAGFSHDMYDYLSKPEPPDGPHRALGYFGPEWWFTLHMIQTPLMGLVAVGLLLLVDGIGRAQGVLAVALAWGSRAATFVFFVYYNALDAIGGIGLGRTIVITEELALTDEQREGVEMVLNRLWNDHWVGGVGSFVSETGSWAVFLSALLAAAALLVARRAPWPALLLLVGFGWELQVGHPMPHGPIAFGLLIVAAAWIARSRRAAPSPAP